MGRVAKIARVDSGVRLVVILDRLPSDDDQRFRLSAQVKGHSKVTDCVIGKDSLEVSIIIEEYLWKYPDRLKWTCQAIIDRIVSGSSCLDTPPSLPDPQ